MKFITILCLTSAVLLTGCASTGINDTAADQKSLYDLTVPVRSLQAQTNDDLLSSQSAAESRRLRAAAAGIRPPVALSDDPLQPLIESKISAPGVAQLSPPADLWERIRRGYAMPNLENDLVQEREQWYSTRPDYILRMTERSRKYMFYIVEELERRNMPTELALLPFVESAFNPQAVSSAKAAGIWQFMPATGRNFELKQNAFRDDRRDVLASTRAALDYMQKLHDMFGDWQLALAAYNWGEGSVGRAIAKNQRNGQGLSYTELSMPNETRFYVPKLQALKNIIANPEAFNSRLPLIENHPYFQAVEITRDIDVALAAKLAEIPVEDFRSLNPSANRPVILAAGTPQILLPWNNVETFQRNLQAYSGESLASWTVWLAPSTMKPADAARQVGMSEAEFRSVNKIPPRMLIKAGSSLLVPRAAGLKTDVLSHTADHGQLSLAPEVVLRRMQVKAGKKDTVASVAQRHQVSAASVAEWNHVSASAAFKAGQSVVLFLPSQGASVSRNKGSARAAPAARVSKAVGAPRGARKASPRSKRR